MRIAVYGGSFNPPHVGHLLVSAWVRWTDRADAVWWVPVRGHPFAKDLAPYEARVDLCRAAVALLPDAAVSTIESELPVPSYTIDTLDALAARFSGDTFRLVVGADVLGEVHRWKSWDVLAARYAPIVVGRGGYPCPPDAVAFPEVSSTDVRRRAAAGEPLDAWVPAVLVDRVRALYGGGPSPT